MIDGAPPDKRACAIPGLPGHGAHERRPRTPPPGSTAHGQVFSINCHTTVNHHPRQDTCTRAPAVRTFLYSFKRRLRRLAARVLAPLRATPPTSFADLDQKWRSEERQEPAQHPGLAAHSRLSQSASCQRRCVRIELRRENLGHQDPPAPGPQRETARLGRVEQAAHSPAVEHLPLLSAIAPTAAQNRAAVSRSGSRTPLTAQYSRHYAPAAFALVSAFFSCLSPP